MAKRDLKEWHAAQGIQTNKQTTKQTNKQTNKQPSKQASKQTNKTIPSATSACSPTSPPAHVLVASPSVLENTTRKFDTTNFLITYLA